MEEKIKQLAEKGQRSEAICLLEEYLQREGVCEDDLLQLGEWLYAEGRSTEALNKFNAVLRLNPKNRKAANYVTMINNILGYYCKDLLNP